MRRISAIVMSVILMVMSVDITAFATESYVDINGMYSEDTGDALGGNTDAITTATEELYVATSGDEECEEENAQSESETFSEAESVETIESLETSETDEDTENEDDSSLETVTELTDEEVEMAAASIIHSGRVGNIDWSIDSDGELLVRGTGDYTMNQAGVAPWCDFYEDIYSAVVELTDITSLEYFFNGCYKLTGVDFSKLDTSKVKDFSYMFCNCGFTTLDLSSLDTSAAENMQGMFNWCTNLTGVNLSGFDTSGVTDMSHMFEMCNNLETLDLSMFDTSSVTNMNSMFVECQKLENLDISKFNTSNVTDMEIMFAACNSLKTLDLRGFNTAKVTGFGRMFDHCIGLESLNVGSFDTSSCTGHASFSCMFRDCKNLKSLDVSSFKTSKAVNMYGMFEGCESLESLDLSNFDTSGVSDNMTRMFHNCKSLKKLDLRNFDTSSNSYYWEMFAGCESLTELNVSSFIIKPESNMDAMFAGCSSLTELNISNFEIIDCFTDDMLKDCVNLEAIISPGKTGNDSIELPKTIGEWYRTDTGEKVNEISANMDKSVRYEHHFTPVDLANATVTMQFAGYNAPGAVVNFDKTKAESAAGIVPETVEVKIGNEIINPGHYDISYTANRAAGVAYLIISAKNGTKACTGSQMVPFTIIGKKLSDARCVTVAFPYNNNTIAWNGGATEHLPVVADISDRNKYIPLTKDEDYKLIFSNNDKPGVATVTVIGIGGYEGSRDIKYTILKASFANATTTGDHGSIKTNLRNKTYTYDGLAKKPEVEVTWYGNDLVAGKDYTVSYKNNINVYELVDSDADFNPKKAPQVVITGKGNYQGSMTLYFIISKVSLDDVEISYVTSAKNTGKPITPKPVISIKNSDGKVVKFNEKSDYVIYYRNNVDIYTYDIYDAEFDKNLAPQFFITATTTGRLCGPDKLLFFTITDSSMNIADGKKFSINTKIPEKNFTGKEVELSIAEAARLIVPAVNGKAPVAPADSDYLVQNKDFVLTYANNINAGTAKVTITGIGKYYGSKTITYKIAKRTVSSTNVNDLSIVADETDVTNGYIPSYDYTGLAIKPDVVVTDTMGTMDTTDDYTLVSGKDYSIAYGNNTNISYIDAKGNEKNATFKITFKGNYAGVAADKTNALTREYKIESWDLSDTDTLIYIDGIKYDGVNFASCSYNNGKAVKPAVAIYRKRKDGSEIAISPKAYKLAYANNTLVASHEDALGPMLTIAPANKNITAPLSGNKNLITLGFDINKGDLSRVDKVVVAKIAAQVYKGKEVTPKVTVKYLGTALKQDRDYTLEYIDNYSRGMATVKIRAIDGSNFVGETETFFIIK